MQRCGGDTRNSVVDNSVKSRLPKLTDLEVHRSKMSTLSPQFCLGKQAASRMTKQKDRQVIDLRYGSGV